MKKFTLFGLLLTLVACAEDEPSFRNEPTTPSNIEQFMQLVCDWQLSHPIARIDAPNEMWERSAFYLGVMATYRVTQQKKYLDATSTWAQTQDLVLGPRKFHADDQVIGQVYLDLYVATSDTAYVTDVVQQSYELIEHPARGRELWNWCDALFMAPPMLAQVAALRQDTTYFAELDARWWDVYEQLYDLESGLFYRDVRYITALNENGKKIFWSRGNGWVLAGLARMLSHWPESSPLREKYILLFQQMAESVAQRQHPDGLWRTNLADDYQFPKPETSGTAFFTYAIAWGINQGILSEAHFVTTVTDGWKGLVNAVNEDGRLGWVQQPSHEPEAVYFDGYQEYATGAFLLAGQEVRTLMQRTAPQ